MSISAKLPLDRFREILGAITLALTVFFFLALVTDGYQGSVYRPLDGMADVYNVCGAPGAIVAGVLSVVLGYAAHTVYFVTCVWSFILFRHRPLDRFAVRMVGLLLLTGSVAALLHIDFSPVTEEGLAGGAFGAYVSSLLLPWFGRVGSNVVGLTLGAVGILLATEFLFLRAARKSLDLSRLVLWASHCLYGFVRTLWQRYHDGARVFRRAAAGKIAKAILEAPRAASGEPGEKDNLERIRIRPDPMKAESENVKEDIPFDAVPHGESNVVKLPREAASGSAQPTARALAEPASGEAEKLVVNGPAPGGRATPRATPRKAAMPRRKTVESDELPADYVYPRHYSKPSMDLLDRAAPRIGGERLTEMLRHTSVLLEKALETHGIEARVTDVTRGPTITRYELEPAPGIKVSRFLSLADDLALALKAQGVRVEAPIPGKGRIGIELPNTERESVVLRELLESPVYKGHGGKLVLPLGKDIAGDVVAADLASMPHLLVAGATGAGKTVCIKALLASLLFNKTPEELQLVLIDPKKVELSIFDNIPNLITPVVTDAKKAASALNWLISEMEERYLLFAQLRVRNIEVYNESVENGEIELPQTDPDSESGSGESVDIIRKLPYIVCIIDELADLMMLARAEVEDAIMRLAQLARAVGIHLVIATQRPSVNVLTGVIKANFPVRIAFQVSSKVDSRCILDEMGAERLIGRGDMLYLPAGRATPTRIQGAFVSDSEMEDLIRYLKTQAPPQYRDEIENFGKSPDSIEDLANETDDLLDEAVRVVLETGQASISMVQRRLRVGYTRAARLIDMMELKGIVGPHMGSKAREILVDCAPVDKTA